MSTVYTSGWSAVNAVCTVFMYCAELALKAAWLGGSLFMYRAVPVRLPVAVIV